MSQEIDLLAPFRERAAKSGRLLLIVEEDLLRETIDAREVAVVDMDAQRLELSQPEPPLPSSAAGRVMEIAAPPLPDEGGAARPLGYHARLLEVNAESLVVSPPSGVRETSLRTVHRLPVRREWGLVLRLEGIGRVRLVDISARGALAALRTEVPALDARMRFILGQAESWEVEGVATVRRILSGGSPEEKLVGLGLETDTPGQAALLQRTLFRLG
ncbi:hypothetical protein dsx2_2420 [Desulfovibrio sp. X2]|uniref:hypothetical protein n=1 Tax=Desulfovibrio sp. X2 TaxID=941449 RepID=UPI000358CC4D|nr:hypothetical protein [Desulfovibrio sp. X2]EPR43376.1 hypothetical protein dsx2_2420 [Desulfovibrio sp. X2]